MTVIDIDQIIQDALDITEEILLMVPQTALQQSGLSPSKSALEWRQKVFPLVAEYLNEHTDFYSASRDVVRKMVVSEIKQFSISLMRDFDNGAQHYRTNPEFLEFLKRISYGKKPFDVNEVANVLTEHVKSAKQYGGVSRVSTPLASNTLELSDDERNNQAFREQAKMIFDLSQDKPELLASIQHAIEQARQYRTSVMQFATPSTPKSLKR